MHRNAQQQYYNWLLERIQLDLGVETILSKQRSNGDTCGDTIYPYHRVGYDGQVKVLATEHAVFFFRKMLPVSTHSYQDSTPNSKEESHVHR